MSDATESFGKIAASLSRSPLEIIALFIVLVYGFASLVFIFAGDFAPAERLLLVCFLVSFPILVLLVFAWLVSKHANKLFGPGLFKDERLFLELLNLKTVDIVSPLRQERVRSRKPARP